MESTIVCLVVLFGAFPSARGDFSNAVVTSVQPIYGPVSGGTVLTIDGSNLDPYPNDTPFVMLNGTLQCNTTSWNNNTIIASTPPLGDMSLSGTALPISLEAGTGNTTDTVDLPDHHTYTYQPDPVITKVEPLEAISNGGIKLTVHGASLDSVAQTILVVTKATTTAGVTTEEEFTSPCNEPGSTIMICPTPELDEPSTRKKRDIRNLQTTHLLRSRRESESEEFEYYLGFIQDGLDKYRDLRTTNVSGILKVTEPPDIEVWEGVQDYKPGDSLSIAGEDMDVGCTVDDYLVTIGLGNCSDYTLTPLNLVCKPPETEPGQNETTDSSDGHRVYVHIGRHQSFVGLLKYNPNNKWYGGPVVLAGICTAAGLCVFLGVLVICKFCCRQKQGPKWDDQYLSQGLGHGNYDDEARERVVVRKHVNNDMYLNSIAPNYGPSSPSQPHDEYFEAFQRGYERPFQQPGPYIEAAY